jgi:hypothetical protein
VLSSPRELGVGPAAPPGGRRRGGPRPSVAFRFELNVCGSRDSAKSCSMFVSSASAVDGLSAWSQDCVKTAAFDAIW